MATARQFHYTDEDAFKAIRSQTDWVFKASRPAADHPVGAYFTTLEPGTPKLAIRLRIPKRKIAYTFCFVDRGDLRPMEGGRGRFIFYCPEDYTVGKDRQIVAGQREAVMERTP